MIQLSSPLILIIDDNPMNLEVLSAALVNAGYEVAIATRGERALQQIQRSQPDLILLDVMMPGMDGFNICQQIKETLRLSDIPIIFMTALADEESKTRAFELGAVDYITKPFQEKEVLARVSTHLRLKETEYLLRCSEERLNSILNGLEEVVWSMTLDPISFVYLNPAIERVFGCARHELMTHPQLWFEMVHPADRKEVQARFCDLLKFTCMELEYRIINRQGSVRWLKVRAQCQKDNRLYPNNGNTKRNSRLRIDGIIHDISDRKQIETKLIREAQRDDLTGLKNRKYCIEQINAKLADLDTNNSSTSFAVLFIDLDRFKNINDSLGHQIGDSFLQVVAQRLQRIIHSKDIIARLGGDEFAIILTNLHSADDTIRVAKEIHQHLVEPIQLREHTLYTSASIGIVIATPEYRSAEELLRDADIAMYQAKKRGKAGWQQFNQSMYDASLRQLELEQDLRLAINTDQIQLYYQPIVELSAQRLVGFEALVRWIHPTRGIISPGEFIPIAEDSGLIEPLGEQILWLACHQLQSWQAEFPQASEMEMSVNVSSKQLQNEGFLNLIDRIMANTGLSGKHLHLEITESILMENSALTMQLLEKLTHRGIFLSLDDFGTGYSSLSYLHRFPLNELKIDRSFTNRIETDSQSREIVKTITTLAKTLNMNVVAEGVETQEQLRYLQQVHCDTVQGYFFSKPLPSHEAIKWVAVQSIPQTFVSL